MKYQSLDGLTPQVVRELLDYDPSTGNLYFKRRGSHWFRLQQSCNSWNTRFSGKRADKLWTNKENGYQRRTVRLLGKTLKAHHLAWMWMKGLPLPDEIDHIDQDATNNKWRNLKSSTRSLNMRNRSKNKNNTSGVTGVTWMKSSKKWISRCQLDGESKYLGAFDELEHAARAVAEFRASHDYSPSHGESIAHYHARNSP